MTSFIETEEQQALRKAVAAMASNYGQDYYLEKARAGQPLIWLEAMKMEHTVTAPSDGVLAELNVEAGQQVDVGAVLARVDTEEGARQ